MDQKQHIAIVEDNPAQRVILSRLLDTNNDVVSFENGENFLASEAHFDIVLLDIEMPGMNGYETCRKLRERGGEANDVAVVFVSAHDTPPERVAAYEAGGDDFIAKPIAAHELQHKIKSIFEHRRRVQELAAQSSTAQQIAFTAMTSMGDLGVIIEFLRKAGNENSYESIARQLIDAMTAWGLQGAVQIRGCEKRLNMSSDGTMSPLQSSVLDNMHGIGRIFEFGSRAVVNYDHVSLLIQNLPTQDPDKLGRLRDHLTVLAESADMKLAGVDAMYERNLQKVGIEGSLAELRDALKRIAVHNQSNRLAGQNHLTEQLESLHRTLQNLGLSSSQEGFVREIVRDLLDTTLGFFDEAAHFEEQFAELQERLERLVASDYRL